ncbi:ankyrin repeat domain-containing protein [Microbacterium amylolyticum]|uniref:Ankyrin repeat protein n=1 Tax=Microbacterium amylolyticum TaxID=936337 RepID=A0ABS4ZE03_9MICO|nr:ankyrin repeat domain-containing protein [Microbacterium amylolyticum]MBP2435506.1 ankyrin repeat protein [Microbacterium amylolyticum]
MTEEIPDDIVAFASRVFDLARSGDATVLEYVDQGVAVDLTNDAGDTLLMLASYNGHATLVEGLLERGADPNKLNDRGQSPTAGAVFKGFDDVIGVLVAGGADLDAGQPSARATAQMFGRNLPA